MPFFDKARRQKRREERRDRRKQNVKTRLNNARRTIDDNVSAAGERLEAIRQEKLNLKLREERIVRRGERTLVIFSEFNEYTESAEGLKKLYRFLEGSGISVAASLLAASYDRILPCTGVGATPSALTDTLREALADRDVDELDLLWHGHGNLANDGAYFSMAPGSDDPSKDMYHVDEISAAIEDVDAEDRLRMFYTTACFGSKLAEEMVESGFNCGAGALGVNTNAAIEYPLFLKYWASLMPFGVAVSLAFNKSGWRATDAAVRAFDQHSKNPGRFEDVNSFKETFGDRSTNIRSNADF